MNEAWLYPDGVDEYTFGLATCVDITVLQLSNDIGGLHAGGLDEDRW